MDSQCREFVLEWLIPVGTVTALAMSEPVGLA
jgi:hypothetical protein